MDGEVVGGGGRSSSAKTRTRPSARQGGAKAPVDLGLARPCVPRTTPNVGSAVSALTARTWTCVVLHCMQGACRLERPPSAVRHPPSGTNPRRHNIKGQGRFRARADTSCVGINIPQDHRMPMSTMSYSK